MSRTRRKRKTRKKRSTAKYKSENELCEAFIEIAELNGWTVYPETSNWDMLIIKDGIQIGVEAKLRANLEVISQALPRRHSNHKKAAGPHYRAVLVPKSTKHFVKACTGLGIYIFDLENVALAKRFFNTPDQYDKIFKWETNKLCWLPDYIPDVKAGVPSPISLTPWKQKALMLIAVADIKGYVTSADAKEIDIGFANFSKLYLKQTDEKEGRRIKWVLKNCKKRPDKQHPRVYGEILANTKKVLG